jgi:arylsulfatase A
LPKDAAEDSHDLTPLLMGSTTPIRTTHVHNTKVDHYAIRHGDWLLVDAKDGYVSGRNKVWEDKWSYPADDDQAVELYDLSTDPGQRSNLATANAQKVQQLRTLLKTVREQGYSAPRLAP